MPRRPLFLLLGTVAPVGDYVPDQELLHRFERDQDAAAFELLVRRHSDAIWATCRRVLRSDTDADDAFQAVFLVLIRKHRSIRATSIGAWLHRIAVRAALRLRERTARTATMSPNLLDTRPAPSVAEPEADLASAIHEEIARLPDRYQLPVVLCELEGRTSAEAADVLGWPVGTVSGRLHRARAILRRRLARRGLAPVAAPLALLTFETLPSAAQAASVSAVLAAAAGPIPVPISHLAEGVLSAMRLAKLKLAAIAVSFAVLGLGTALAWPNPSIEVVAGPDPAPPEPAKEAPAEGVKQRPETFTTAFPDVQPLGKRKIVEACPLLFGEDAALIEPADDMSRRILKARLHQAASYLVSFRTRVESGSYLPTDFPLLVDRMNDLRSIVVELWSNDPKALAARLEEVLSLAKEWERFTSLRVNSGTDPSQQLFAATGCRLAVESALWKAKAAKAVR
jgi:RNA polymerase sigma factor (sigma-70 family)